jgi:hypothetical protein
MLQGEFKSIGSFGGMMHPVINLLKRKTAARVKRTTLVRRMIAHLEGTIMSRAFATARRSNKNIYGRDNEVLCRSPSHLLENHL